MSNDSPKLTPRQQEIFELIQQAIATTGAPPTRAEIANQLGFRSANAAEEHLQALARKGVIELVGGTSRGIRLKAGTLRGLHETRRAPASAGKSRLGSLSGLTAGNLPLPGLEQLVLPLVGRVAAGHPILAQEHIEQSYAVEPSLFTRTPDYLLRVKGMSMRDAGILDGDLLAVARTREARNGQIVVARLGDEVTVKRFQRNAQGVTLLPENPDFEPILVGPDTPDFELEGLAVGLIRKDF
ncbi:transcriptional repressor LexA [Aquabacterium sp. A3]|uniref:transcriptional repressor LexA n=1 Tax=Aquabacterium sp. A3 TaxID=3132829 RepID=UPI0031195115